MRRSQVLPQSGGFTVACELEADTDWVNVMARHHGHEYARKYTLALFDTINLMAVSGYQPRNLTNLLEVTASCGNEIDPGWGLPGGTYTAAAIVVLTVFFVLLACCCCCCYACRPLWKRRKPDGAAVDALM